MRLSIVSLSRVALCQKPALCRGWWLQHSEVQGFHWGRAVHLAKNIEPLLFKPILWNVKASLCWRKPGICTNVVATFLSLLLKSFSSPSTFQFNYCDRCLSWFLASCFPHTSNLPRCCFVHTQQVPFWTSSWSLIELYFTSISFLIFCPSPCSSMTGFACCTDA